jgi:hypothetical protein
LGYYFDTYRKTRREFERKIRTLLKSEGPEAAFGFLKEIVEQPAPGIEGEFAQCLALRLIPFLAAAAPDLAQAYAQYLKTQYDEAAFRWLKVSAIAALAGLHMDIAACWKSEDGSEIFYTLEVKLVDREKYGRGYGDADKETMINLGIGQDELSEFICEGLAAYPERAVRKALSMASRVIRDHEHLEPMLRQLAIHDSDDYVRVEAVRALFDYGPQDLGAILVTLASDVSWYARSKAFDMLAQMDQGLPAAASPSLVQTLTNDVSAQVVDAAARCAIKAYQLSFEAPLRQGLEAALRRGSDSFNDRPSKVADLIADAGLVEFLPLLLELQHKAGEGKTPFDDAIIKLSNPEKFASLQRELARVTGEIERLWALKRESGGSISTAEHMKIQDEINRLEAARRTYEENIRKPKP